MLNMNSLWDDFITHINAMSDEEIKASIQYAYQLTAECADEVGDINEYNTVGCDATQSQIILRNSTPRTSSYTFTSFLNRKEGTTEMWTLREEPAA